MLSMTLLFGATGSLHISARQNADASPSCSGMPYACIAYNYVPYQQVRHATQAQLSLAGLRLLACRFPAYVLNRTTYVALHSTLTCTIHGTKSQPMGTGVLDVTIAHITIVGSVVGGAQLVSYAYAWAPRPLH